MPPLFPLRVAAIDIGSNAIRFLAAEFTDPTRSTRLDYVRVPVRMGHEAFLSGRLAEESMDAAVRALADFRARMDGLHVDHYRAVATSAVRESRNGGAFLERAWDESGVRVDEITGIEEARLVWLAVRDRFPLEDRRWIHVDLGGGSVEVSLVDAERVRWSESHPLGTVRLLEELGEGRGDTPEHFRRLLEDQADILRVSAAARRVDAAGMIATGGNIEELAVLAGTPGDAAGVKRLPLSRLREVMATLTGLSIEERVGRLGLREDRADVILPAAVVYERVAELVGVGEIVVPNVGVKDGILLDVVDDVGSHGSHEAGLEQAVLEGALQVARRYDFDEPHGRQVARLALSLFDQLAEVHGMGAAERRILLGAALLHDVGQFVSYRRHHKHSHYLIANSELSGYTPREIQLVALTARYHRRAGPRESHPEFAALGSADRERVERLAALLRIGDALDREHLQRVAGVRARPGDGEVALEVEGSGDLLPEQWALQKKAKLFEQVFRREVRATLGADAAR